VFKAYRHHVYFANHDDLREELRESRQRYGPRMNECDVIVICHSENSHLQQPCAQESNCDFTVEGEDKNDIL